jgi:CO/xanthine dehydrogenase Mo-binding subunit
VRRSGRGRGHPEARPHAPRGDGLRGRSTLNADLAGYQAPRASDLAPRLATVFVENGDGTGPFGAKGVGEGSLVPVSPAVRKALARLTSVRLRELPMTPERV